MSGGSGSRTSSRGRHVASGVGAAAAGSLVLAIGGLLSMSAGLIVIAGVLGFAVGRVMRDTTTDPRTSTATAVAGALGGVALGQLLLWLVAMLEGGVLSPLDYLGQTFGILVPAEFVAAGLVALLASR